MKALGGGFVIQSAPDQGTTARLTLPLVRRDERDGREVRDRRDEQKSGTKPIAGLSPDARVRVLLVDDHAMVRQGLRSVLDGYTDLALVGEASNGEEAVAWLSAWIHRLS